MKHLFTRALAVKLALVLAASVYFSTPSQAFFFHHHHHHYKHVKTTLTPGKPAGNLSTAFLVQYIAGAGICATASLGLQAALAGSRQLSLSRAHGAVAGCFLPFFGEWLLVEHYKRMCALSRTNPAFREYRIYCPA